MRVSVAGKELRVWFKHGDNGSMAIAEYRGEEYTAGSTLAKRDHHNKAVGRRVSLTRLLRQLTAREGFTAQERGEVWRAYFANHRDLKR